MPVISVLMPCYNVDTTLDDAISSLIGQTLSDFEVVVIDDGSTDATLTRLYFWGSRDKRLKVIPNPHLGIIPTLNRGLELCQSDFIARMDADDCSTPTRLRQQVDMLTNHPELAVVTSLVKGFPEEKLGAEFRTYISWLNGLITGEDIKHSMFIRSPMAHPSVAYRREWIERVGGYQDHGWAEDYDLWLRLYLAGAGFSKLPEVLLEWRDHPHRLTHTNSRYSKLNDLRMKAHYLLHGPLSNFSQVMIVGVNPAAEQLGKQLLQLGCPLTAYVGSNLPFNDQILSIISYQEFFDRLHAGQRPAVLLAENDQDQVALIAQQLEVNQMRQGVDWFLVG